MRFLSGNFADVAVVGFLPGEFAAQMPTLSTAVQISSAYAKKIWEKHRLGHQVFGLIQPIIDCGYCIKSRKNNLDFLYIDDRSLPKRYLLGLKAARGGKETWVTTLYTIDEQELRRRLKRANKADSLIRKHL
jgi:hypothetical protein